MKKISLLFFLFTCTLSFSQTAKTCYGIRPVPFHQVKLMDNFWQPRIETVQQVTIPLTFEKSEATGRIKNFEVAGGLSEGKFCSLYAFDDSDVYKAIEGAAYYLHTQEDTAQEAYVNELIAKIGAAQEADGYLYTWRTIEERNKKDGTWTEVDAQNHNVTMAAEKRWEKVDQHSHELYNVGHLYEAAVAWKEATGNDNLLKIALKNADLVLANFGSGKLSKVPGHQEIELGLVRLYEQTGKRAYLDLAKFFLDARGYGEAYMQNHQPLKDQREAVGHAVRLGYMFSAAADITAHTATQEYLSAMNTVWDDIVQKKLYVTGGVGSTGSNEGYSQPYELPNYSAYNETCSSIAFVMWNRRMFQLTGDSKYYDVLERTLYNALNAGLGLNGDDFFYANPLEAKQNQVRKDWFNCACCPPNITRFYSSLPSYIYAKVGREVYINLFASSETTVENVNSRGQIVPVTIVQETAYPYDGKVNIVINPAKPNTFTLKVRLPGWARGDAVPNRLYSFEDKQGQIMLRLNGKILQPNIKNGYAVIKRKWRKNDVLELRMPMAVKKITANGNIAENRGKVALQRGPLVYCLEGKDQSDSRIFSALITDKTVFETTFKQKLLGGVQVLNFDAFLVKDTLGEGDLLPASFTAIPYFTWANRGADNMLVWIPIDLKVAKELKEPTLASQSDVSASAAYQGVLAAVNDQFLPKNSNDSNLPTLRWSAIGDSTTAWVQYDFTKPVQIEKVQVYWQDNEADCRVPNSWRVLYKEKGNWTPIYEQGKTTALKDTWDELKFDSIWAAGIRIEMTLQNGKSVGIYEINVE